MEVIIPSGPIKADNGLSPPRIRMVPTSVPIRMRLLKEFVNVVVTEDHPSLVCSCTGVVGRGVVALMIEELAAGAFTDDAKLAPETDLVDLNALGGALTESDVRRVIVLGNRGVDKTLSESEILGVLAFIVRTGS